MTRPWELERVSNSAHSDFVPLSSIVTPESNVVICVPMYRRGNRFMAFLWLTQLLREQSLAEPRHPGSKCEALPDAV